MLFLSSASTVVLPKWWWCDGKPQSEQSPLWRLENYEVYLVGFISNYFLKLLNGISNLFYRLPASNIFIDIRKLQKKKRVWEIIGQKSTPVLPYCRSLFSLVRMILFSIYNLQVFLSPQKYESLPTWQLYNVMNGSVVICERLMRKIYGYNSTTSQTILYSLWWRLWIILERGPL
jgi:hypothetical protein